MHAQRIHPGLSLCHHLQPEHPPLRVDSHLTSVPPTNVRATHAYSGAGRAGLRNAFPLVRPVASVVPVRSNRALPLFLSGRPFTIGNLHKRLTEARLNHTREREKNRRASEVFVRGGARVRVPWSRSGAMEEAEKKEEGRSRGEARGEADGGRGRRSGQGRDKEGAKALADGGESLRRVARRSYRRYHGGSALSSKSVSSCVRSLHLSPPADPSGTPT